MARYVKGPMARLTPAVIAMAVIAVVIVGWLDSDEGHLTPESGTGYWLGIIGASAMLLLLVYPLRKRIPRLRFLGAVPFWFRFHMLLGIVGPLLVLFHSNFKLGALNSNVALVSMLIVAFSGVVGRYIYGKIYLGLSGHRATVREVLDDAADLRTALDRDLPGGEKVIRELSELADTAMKAPRSVLGGMMSLLAAYRRTHVASIRIGRELRAALAIEAKRQRWSGRERRRRERAIRDLVDVHLTAVNRAAAFGLYERLFALWHVLHLPLFLLLIAAAVVHVIAVHLY